MGGEAAQAAIFVEAAGVAVSDLQLTLVAVSCRSGTAFSGSELSLDFAFGINDFPADERGFGFTS